jgi:hypothetical protein
MGQKPAKIEPPPVDDREFVLSPSLGVFDRMYDKWNDRYTVHVAKELSNGPVRLVLVPRSLYRLDAGIKTDRLYANRVEWLICEDLGTITRVVPTFDGRSVVMNVTHRKYPHNVYVFRVESLPDGNVYMSEPNIFSYGYGRLTTLVNSYTSTYPFTPCGDPLFDNLACLFVPPPQNVADTQNNERS